MEDIKEKKISTLNLLVKSEDYRDFIRFVLSEKLTPIKNQRYLALALKVSTAYITKVLHKKAHLSFENAYTFSKAIKLNDFETNLFFNKLILSKSESQSSRDFIQSRINLLLAPKNQNESTMNQLFETSNLFYANILFFKIYSFILKNKSACIREVSEYLEITEEQANYIMLNMIGQPYNLEIKEIDNKKVYIIKNEKNGFDCLQPNQKVEFSTLLRRCASYSLDLRQPELINDYSKHYATGSYIFKLTQTQITHLKSILNKLKEDIIKTDYSQTTDADSKIVAMTFDLFEVKF